jgi:hypothetical protein
MAYPINFPSVPLTNDVSAAVSVALVNNIQSATISIYSAASLLTTINLSPVSQYATNIEIKNDLQTIKIDRVEFRAAFGFTTGQVVITGSATDQSGQDSHDFHRQIASWSN